MACDEGLQVGCSDDGCEKDWRFVDEIWCFRFVKTIDDSGGAVIVQGCEGLGKRLSEFLPCLCCGFL